MDKTVTETLRQLRDEVDRLYAEALMKLREANAAEREYRAALLAAYPIEENYDTKGT